MAAFIIILRYGPLTASGTFELIRCKSSGGTWNKIKGKIRKKTASIPDRMLEDQVRKNVSIRLGKTI